MDIAQLPGYFSQRQTEMINLVAALVTQETPSADKGRLNAFARFLAGRFAGAGAQVEIIANATRGDHLRARFAHETASGKQALVLCHFDTVWPVGSLETHPFRIEAGKAYGPGIFDMQTSLMLAEFALAALRDLNLTPPRPITVLMTSDEEIGSVTSRALIEEEARQSAYVLVLESPLPGGVLKTARKGVGNFELEVFGRAAHAGVEPEKGVNALEELAHQILRLHSLTDMSQGTTVNVGLAHGGSVSNVIPAHAVAEIDTRAWSQSEADRVERAIRGLQPVMAEARLHVTGGWNRPPLERSATMELFARVRDMGAALGLELREGGTGGGSDGNFTGALGIPTLDGLGVPGAGAHADHEHIEIEGIPGRAALLTAALMQL